MIVQCVIGIACFLSILDQMAGYPARRNPPINDSEYTNCCEPVSCCRLLGGSHPAPGEWAFIGECLYFRPWLDNTSYVIDSPALTVNVITGKEKSNNLISTPVIVWGWLMLFVNLIEN